MAENDKIRSQASWGVEVASGSADARAHSAWSVYVAQRDAEFVNVQDAWAAYVGINAAPYVFAHYGSATYIAGGASPVTLAQEAYVVFIGIEGVIPAAALESKAYFYELDGHQFYVLNIGDQGTWAYDTTTGQWTRWATGTLPLLNADLALQWRGEQYAASLLEPAIVKFNPSSVLDDGFRETTYRVTGRIEYKDRRYAPNPEAQIFGSIGLRGGDVRLRYSNDDGETWSTQRVRTVAADDRSENVIFRDLGSVRAPGRLYEIEDNGTLRRIQSLRVKVGAGGDGA